MINNIPAYYLKSYNRFLFLRSKIQGLGLYAARDLEKHTMVIEYIGEIIRTELAETREKKYEASVCLNSRNCAKFVY